MGLNDWTPKEKDFPTFFSDKTLKDIHKICGYRYINHNLLFPKNEFCDVMRCD